MRPQGPRGGPDIVSDHPTRYKGLGVDREGRVADYKSIIPVDDLVRRLNDAELLIVDARFDLMNPAAGRLLWHESRIPGAVYADLDGDLAGPIREDTGRHPLPSARLFLDWLAAAGAQPGSQIVVYDDASGGIAARAWWLLRWLGQERVAVLDGGFRAWLEAGLPLDSGDAPGPGAGRWQAEPQPRMEWVVLTEELASEPAAPRRLRLVDARARERFEGKFEPIDPVAGHVPGATNLPFTELLDGEGRFLPAEEVRERLSAHLEGNVEAPWTVMCGSGVTACHLALAAEYAGLRPPSVYVGSFSEWLRSPERPVARSGS